MEELKNNEMFPANPQGFEEALANIENIQTTYMQKFRVLVGMRDCPDALPTPDDP
jgi:hypothetical protein